MEGFLRADLMFCYFVMMFDRVLASVRCQMSRRQSTMRPLLQLTESECQTDASEEAAVQKANFARCECIAVRLMFVELLSLTPTPLHLHLFPYCTYTYSLHLLSLYVLHLHILPSLKCCPGLLPFDRHVHVACPRTSWLMK